MTATPPTASDLLDVVDHPDTSMPAKADLAGVVDDLAKLADGYTITPNPAIETFNDRLLT